jgi:hypothetical protein
LLPVVPVWGWGLLKLENGLSLGAQGLPGQHSETYLKKKKKKKGLGAWFQMVAHQQHKVLSTKKGKKMVIVNFLKPF